MTINENYQQTLSYLFSQLPMFQRVGPMAFKKDLGNIKALCDYLDHPEQKFKSIHIAGTNGKGSTAHLLAAGLQAADYKVGLYTSPHYKDFRERIKINGQLISKRFVVDWVADHQNYFNELKPSFFEITVALAFDYFAQQGVDVAVIETGLGGRLDSTNIILPKLSVITNISFDHQQFLGDTLPEIADEKAGIIKKNIPVVIGETQNETKPVFIKKAQKENAPITFADDHFRGNIVKEVFAHSIFSIYKDGKLWLKSIPIQLHGKFQEKNVATAFQVFDILRKQENFKKLNWENVKHGLANLTQFTRFMGRWQIIGQEPLIICDSGHNEGGLRQTMQQLDVTPFNHLHIIMGVVNDKSLDKVLPHFPKGASYYFAKADIPRGLPAKELKAQAESFGLKGRAYSSVKNAFRAAKRKAQPTDVIFVGGSIFVVAESIITIC